MLGRRVAPQSKPHSNLKRLDLEASTACDGWNFTLLYGETQADIGFLDRLHGILGRVKPAENRIAFGGARYDLNASKFNRTNLGIGYTDDCLILGVDFGGL